MGKQPVKKRRTESPERSPDNDVSLLLIGDMHFSQRTLLQSEQAAALVLRFLDKYAVNVDGVVMLGDLIEGLEWDSIARAQQWIRDISTRKRLYYIIGNHDRPSPHTINKNHPFHGLGEDVLVVDEPQLAVIKGYSFGFVPYTPPSELKGEIDKLGEMDMTAVFGHNTYGGSHGYPWPASYPPMLTGHDHTHEWIPPNIMRVGTPYQVRSIDSADTGIMLVRFRGEKAIEVTPFQELLKAPVVQCIAFAYQRISLNIPHRAVVHRTCEEMVAYQHEDTDKVIMTHIYVSGTRADMARLKTKPFFKGLMRHPKISVTYRLQETSTRVMGARHMPLLDVLHAKIKTDRTREIYNRLFKAT